MNENKYFPDPQKKTEGQLAIANITIEINRNDRAFPRLAEKLAEYNERLSNASSTPEMKIDAIYKCALIEELLKNGKVATLLVADYISEKSGFLNTKIFNDACVAIQEYIKAEGKI